MKPAFMKDCDKDFTPELFIAMICTPRPDDEIKADMFIDDLLHASCREAILEQVLQFCTGLKLTPNGTKGLHNNQVFMRVTTSQGQRQWY